MLSSSWASSNELVVMLRYCWAAVKSLGFRFEVLTCHGINIVKLLVVKLNVGNVRFNESLIRLYDLFWIIICLKRVFIRKSQMRFLFSMEILYVCCMYHVKKAGATTLLLVKSGLSEKVLLSMTGNLGGSSCSNKVSWDSPPVTLAKFL